MRKPFEGDYRLSQGFGENPAMYAKFGYKGHNGLDYACPTGTSILAPISGTVLEAADDTAGYGLYLKIQNDKEGVVLGHNKTLLVKVGDVVTEGQKVAVSDNTGNSTGPHCHFGYYPLPRDRSNGYGGFVDQSGMYEEPVDENHYKGYNLNSIPVESLKVMIDATTDLQKGELVRKVEIEKLQVKITGLETSQNSLAQRVLELEGQIKTNSEVEALSKEQIESLTNEKQKLSELVETYKPYKGWYETKLEEVKNLVTVDKLSAVQLISLGVKKLWTERKAIKK